MNEQGLLIIPRLRVQNANCISSPMTWGFPAMTAFTGLMVALERKVHEHTGLEFLSVGVICHHFAAQVTTGGYTRTFCLTRNPVDKDGSTAAIVEEGRAHLEITLVFGVAGSGMAASEEQRQQAARHCADVLATLRIAGGSVLPAEPGTPGYYQQPTLKSLSDNPDLRASEFRSLRRQWLPGFALVCRDDLLTERLHELRQSQPQASRLDAWLDLSRLHIRPHPATEQTQAPATLEITLVFGVAGSGMAASEEQRQQAARHCADVLATLRIAGGSVLPAEPGTPGYYQQPTLKSLSDNPDLRASEFRSLRRQWLPGFALVCRDDLLTERLHELRQSQPQASRLDAWLDLSRLHIRPHPATEQTQAPATPATDKVEWEASRPPGWLVPIPVGFGALSPLHQPGEVAHARDMTVPFRFVESLYSIGQWLSPHRLQSPEQLLWYSTHDDSSGLYRCQNDYSPSHITDFA